MPDQKQSQDKKKSEEKKVADDEPEIQEEKQKDDAPKKKKTTLLYKIDPPVPYQPTVAEPKVDKTQFVKLVQDLRS